MVITKLSSKVYSTVRGMSVVRDTAVLPQLLVTLSAQEHLHRKVRNTFDESTISEAG
jgi:hypothetical protein